MDCLSLRLGRKSWCEIHLKCIGGGMIGDLHQNFVNKQGSETFEN